MTHCGDFLQMELAGATQIMHIPKPFQFFMIKKDRNIAQFLYRCFIEGNVVKCMKHFGQVCG